MALVGLMLCLLVCAERVYRRGMINEARERLVGVWRLTAYQDRSSVEDERDDTYGVKVAGTNRRILDGECWEASPAGTWSPDGSRIVCSDGDYDGINVFARRDVTTGENRG